MSAVVALHPCLVEGQLHSGASNQSGANPETFRSRMHVSRVTAGPGEKGQRRAVCVASHGQGGVLAEIVAQRRLRAKVERVIDRLLAVLDELDGDPEAEPWLGALETSAIGPQWLRSSTDDREEEDEDGGDVLDELHDAEPDEPSLGAAEGREDQRRWAAGNMRDLEGGLPELMP